MNKNYESNGQGVRWSDGRKVATEELGILRPPKLAQPPEIKMRLEAI